MHTRWGLLGLIAALASTGTIGCAHGPVGWKTVSSEHFRIHSDQGAHSYEWVMERLEDVHDGLAQSFFGNTKTPPLEVIVFSETEFHDLVSNRYGGMFLGEHGKQG